MLFQKASLKAGFSVNQEETKKEEKNNLVQNVISNNINNNENITKEQKNWYIEIPAISIKAPIAEGTTKEIKKFSKGGLDYARKQRMWWFWIW